VRLVKRRVTPQARNATALDVARRAGVSQSAVSRAFTPGASVARETREKIVEAARELGYRPNAIARTLITRRSRIVALVVAYLQNHFYPDVIESLSKRLQAIGYHILLFTADIDRPVDPVVAEILGYQPDAVVLASASLTSALADECRAAGIPVLLFNRTTQARATSSVTGDNLTGGRTIADFLVAGGHKRLGFIAGIEDSSTSRDREAGYTTRLAELGFPAPTRAVGHYSLEGAAAATRQLLSEREPPDAIFCANDHMAIAATEVIRAEFGWRIPQDVSLVGFDDVGPARWSAFSLTSFSQPLEPMVETAFDILSGLLEDPATPPRHVRVPGELVVRGSARVPPGVVDAGGRRIWKARG
jgi:DNA-binding LacI/PurR family transcriptional regulator